MFSKIKVRYVLPFVFALGCAAASGIVAVAGGLACGALTAIIGPGGEYWGTACQGLVKAIATEIQNDTTPATTAARAASSCSKASVVPVPGFESVAAVCPGFDPFGVAPFDYLGDLTVPFTRIPGDAGDYMILLDPSGNRTQDPPGAKARRRALIALSGRSS